ncbi:hypothetical protein CBOM_01955 [Ceraceosorus bombacis]|uniref:Uncharacterized protein n=1 Tax=Ceraceosorus bombacis TaxID=401625 RepID=A0A0P1BE28_9BASI|nr:hypothetical protein CBOM_01955 [Ceraceosorus bombacis]
MIQFAVPENIASGIRSGVFPTIPSTEAVLGTAVDLPPEHAYRAVYVWLLGHKEETGYESAKRRYQIALQDVEQFGPSAR